jgi:RES domain-containing protein
VLEVPTSIVPLEHNYLLNPAHPDFAQIRLEKPRRFGFDERLRGS